MDSTLDSLVRSAAFEWLTSLVGLHGDVLPRTILAEGFTFKDSRVPLLGPQGIFKPRILNIPLSITTVPSGPYDDGFSSNGLMEYRYRGEDPSHRDNAGLRYAMTNKIPLVYFYRVVAGKYLAVWPVFVVGDDPKTLTFTVEVDDAQYIPGGLANTEQNHTITDDGTEARRSYITATVRNRLHQRAFRERVLHAYREHCALCRLRHGELLDAAHIIPDSEPDGDPIVPNGLALCKLHHAAFDRQFLAVRPDYSVEIRRDILEERDGPMLLHGLIAMHNTRILLPRSASLRPGPELLERRYRRFLEVEANVAQN